MAKTCIHPNCKKHSSFNKEGETKPIYCSEHKKDGMVNVRCKICIHPNCKTQPTYNYEGETKRLYCYKHKKEGMVDVKSKTCIHPNCKTRPYYNNEGKTKGLYCFKHKNEGMVNVVSKTCKSEWCSTQCQKKYDGYCAYCYMHLFPDKPMARNYKTKEHSVVEFVLKYFPNFDWVSDKKVQDGCSKRRPDLLLDLGYQVLIIEVDENQHNTKYDCSCENKRLMELSKDCDHRPIIFIRFNPDIYYKGKKKISSCWKINGNGICVINNKKDWEHRLNSLKLQVEYWSLPGNKTNKTVEIIQLFYNTGVKVNEKKK